MSSSTQLLALRKRAYQVLEPARPGDRLSRIVDLTLIGLITANVITIVLESMESLMEAYETFFIAFFQAGEPLTSIFDKGWVADFFLMPTNVKFVELKNGLVFQ